MGFTKEDLKHINIISDKISELEQVISSLKSSKYRINENYGKSFLGVFKAKRRMMLYSVIQWDLDKVASSIELDEECIDAVIKVLQDRLIDLKEQFHNYKIL